MSNANCHTVTMLKLLVAVVAPAVACSYALGEPSLAKAFAVISCFASGAYISNCVWKCVMSDEVTR